MTAPWLPPDSRPADAYSAAVLPPPAPAFDADGSDSGVDRSPPIRLRPMTVSDVLDGGLTIIKSAPRTVFTIAAAFVVPLELAAAWINRDTLSDRGFAGAIAAATSTSSDSSITGTTVLGFVLSGMVLALATGAIAHHVSSWYRDAPASAGESLRVALRRAPALLVAWIVVHAAETTATIALFVPALFVMPLLMVTSPIVVIEHRGPLAAVNRSWGLARRHMGAMMGTALLVAAVDLSLTVALGGVGGALSLLPYGWVADVACQAATSLVTVPFVAGATTLAYLDLRVRSEGLDLELAITDHFTR